MVQDIVIEPVGDGPYVRIFVDGDNIAHLTRKATFVFEAGKFPTMTIEVPFMRCIYKGKGAVHFENETGDPATDVLVEENKHLREMIDDLNRRISILLDT